jgi:hypothetical protein
MRSVIIAVYLIAVFFLAACSPYDDPGLYPKYDSKAAAPPSKLPLVETDPNRNLLWGDLHIHTSLSTDAYVMGVRKLPDDAYIFAQGGEIEHGAGNGIRIGRPLDFAAVTDHSEYLGIVRHLDPVLPLSVRSLGVRLSEDSPLRNTIAWIMTIIGFDLKIGKVEGSDGIQRDAWVSIIESAERNYQPGHFTTFIGYEWTSMPNANNLHRNVIYKSNNVPDLPVSSVDSKDPRDLWSALEAQRQKGMDNLAIPHNGNVSGGLMYDSKQFDGTPMNLAYATRRMLNEPVSEIFQVKGSSETHPQLSPNDQFAGFEIVDTKLSAKLEISEPKGGYIRDALRLGLEMSHSEGFNPYRFGVIGSTDGHNAASSFEEDNFFGKLPLLDGSAGIRMGKSILLPEPYRVSRLWGAAGLAAVWATSNTRESIFEAIQRKETFSTSGPRISVRFFGGWRYPEDLVGNRGRIAIAEKTGVPMGGQLPKPNGDAPTFAVWAAKDPASGNLDRIQIIKGWIDTTGKSHEKIYNVALSDRRKPDPKTGEIPDVGNTVDITSATYENTIGDVQLSSVWRDPEFDPGQEAFYYARVIEIPTPRWSTYDAVSLKIDVPEPSSLQERAITSAIWYKPY